LVHDLQQMRCAEQCVLAETTLERRRPYEADRQRLATAIQETVNRLDMAVNSRLLTAAEARLLHTFKRAFTTFHDQSSDVIAVGLLAETPAETAEAQALARGKGQDAFDQAAGAAQQLVARLGGAVPAAEAVTAALGFPSIGSTWVHHILVHSEGMTVTTTHTVLADATHGGRPVHRMSDGDKITLYDKATGNWTAELRGERELRSASPYIAFYAFPLWVGKLWQGTHDYANHQRDQTFSDITWLGRVTASEDVTVPAGTFQTFKVEGTDVYTVRLSMWYAPTLHTVVKFMYERLPDHHEGPGTFTSELLEYAAK
jgi:hypothetical protein